MTTYNLTASGLKEAKTLPDLKLNSRVFAFGGGMCQSTFAVISEPDEAGNQKLVKMSNHYEGSYFGPFKTIGKMSFCRPLSEKFGIGFYWDDIEPDFRFNESEVKKAIETANIIILKQEQAASEKTNRDQKEINELPGLFPFLTPGADNTMKNIRAMLKEKFTGFKFSVRMDHYDAVKIHWEDGPTRDEVEKWIDKFEDHENDDSGDFRDYKPSNFNKVFGGAKYIFCGRNMTEETEKILHPIIKELFQKEPFDSHNFENLCWKLFCQNYIPLGAKITGIKETGETGGLNDINTFYKIKYNEKI